MTATIDEMALARQEIKTTLLKSLEQSITSNGEYYALYCSLEAVQSFPEPEREIPQVFNCIVSAIRISSLPRRVAKNHYDKYLGF